MSKTNTGVFAKEGYEACTGLRALERAGQCKNLNGHVHEIMFCDKWNINPGSIIQGKQAMLTKANTAPVHDVVIMKNGHFSGGFQLKDTVSNSGINKTLKQINSGKYSHTNIVGTEETVSKIGNRTAQKVHSSGISSETTKRIADKALGRLPSVAALGSVARSGGVAGAGIRAGIEMISSINDVCKGRKTIDKAVADVGKSAVKGGITGAGSAVAGSVVSGATGAAIGALSSTGVGTALLGTAAGAATAAAAPIVAGFAGACAVASFISSIFDD
ncbi:MAG: hypothetical protein IK062_01005 [Selenomonadaceae bacterium]|nr:hypothetical protein [Selenomonadaceae bacterium]